jgi:hypothetical protein
MYVEKANLSLKKAGTIWRFAVLRKNFNILFVYTRTFTKLLEPFPISINLPKLATVKQSPA